MDSTQTVIYQSSSQTNQSRYKFPPLLAALWERVEESFPKITQTDQWKQLPPSQKTALRRDMFRLLYGSSPEIFTVLLEQRKKKMKGGAHA